VDPIVRLQLQHEFARLQSELSKTVVFVTHDVDEAIALATIVAVLRPGGRLAQIGSPAEVLAAPVDEFVANFVGVDRAVKLLGLRPASTVPSRPISEPVPGWRLEGRTWLSATGLTAEMATVGPEHTARHALDRALANPARLVVHVDAAGEPYAVSTFEDIGVRP
jgi:osmoprotectant transport system ATP-binding protein